MKPKYLFLFVILAGFSGCSNKTSTYRKPVANIQITPSNKIVTHGNECIIQIQTKLFKDKLASVEVFFNNELIKKSYEPNFNLIINTLPFGTGNHTISVKTFTQSGKSNINFSSVLILSDFAPKQSAYRIEEILFHDNSFFTQGLEFYQDRLYEGTGNYGESKIVVYDPLPEKIYLNKSIENHYFGEGITLINHKLYQLTYKSQKGFIYDAITLERIGDFSFQSNEGWGLCNDGEHLIMSDGSSKIHYLDTLTFERIKSVEICDNKGTIMNINELEYVDEMIYANIWMTNTIIKFNPKNGKVYSIYDLSDITNHLENKNIDVMNGIAYHKKENMFYITGKYWPKMFKIRLY